MFCKSLPSIYRWEIGGQYDVQLKGREVRISFYVIWNSGLIITGIASKSYNELICLLYKGKYWPIEPNVEKVLLVTSINIRSYSQDKHVLGLCTTPWKVNKNCLLVQEYRNKGSCESSEKSAHNYRGLSVSCRTRHKNIIVRVQLLYKS